MLNTPAQEGALAPGGAPKRLCHQVFEDKGTALMGQYWLKEKGTPLLFKDSKGHL